jgi:hypothetical protein
MLPSRVRARIDDGDGCGGGGGLYAFCEPHINPPLRRPSRLMSTGNGCRTPLRSCPLTVSSYTVCPTQASPAAAPQLASSTVRRVLPRSACTRTNRPHAYSPLEDNRSRRDSRGPETEQSATLTCRTPRSARMHPACTAAVPCRCPSTTKSASARTETRYPTRSLLFHSCARWRHLILGG